MSIALSRVVCVVALGGLSSAALAQNGFSFVNAQANIFGYGIATPAPAGGGGGQLAPAINLTPGFGRVATFSAAGQAGWANQPFNGPDGGSFSSTTNLLGVGPISGYAAPLSGHLVGVFIEAGDISALSAPGTLSYPNLASFQQSSYAPGLRQVFFIGDGLTGTGSGSAQTFAVPDGASQLVLGIADGFGFAGSPGFYGDNVGGYETAYAIIPAPGAMAAFALAGLGALRRRR